MPGRIRGAAESVDAAADQVYALVKQVREDGLTVTIKVLGFEIPIYVAPGRREKEDPRVSD